MTPDSESRSFFYYMACVLGTGILALPVKTAKSGYYPFLVIFLLVLMMEISILLYAIELLQTSYILMEKGITSFDKLRNSSKKLVQNDKEESGTENENEDEKKKEIEKSNDSTPLLGNSSSKNQKQKKQLNLHLMGKIFLYNWARVIFDICVFIHFITILISYILAGSESWGEIFGIHVNCQTKATPEQENKIRYIILGFGFLFTLAIIFGERLFAFIASILTSVKGSLLLLMVALAAVVALDINNTITSDWRYIADGFLMSTVALGGAVNLLPLLYNGVPQNKTEIRKFRASQILGLCTCAILILLWTFFVMKAVPQNSDGNLPSLSGAAENGCISTIPLTEIIRTQRENLDWIAYVVEVFIVVSVTVSFITVGSGLKNFIDAYVNKFNKIANRRLGKSLAKGNSLSRGCKTLLTKRIFIQVCVYCASFLLPMAFALGKPKCFLVILEYFSSLGLNLENGAFISWMYWQSNRYKEGSVQKRASKIMGRVTSIIVTILFLLAIVYSFVDFFRRAFFGGTLC